MVAFNRLDPDVRAVLGAVFSDLVTVGLGVLANYAAEARVRSGVVDSQDPEPDEPNGDEAEEAARLLGVDLEATADEIRAALRRRLVETESHPDHGGDAALAARFIAAKNLLIERARSRR